MYYWVHKCLMSNDRNEIKIKPANPDFGATELHLSIPDPSVLF